MDILTKIKQANLVGRGGASFPTALKWEAVKQADSLAKYVVINAAEGEPGVKKDGYILEHQADRVIDGARLAVEYLGATRCYLFINPKYYEAYRPRIMKAVKAAKLEKKFGFFVKPHQAGYIGGEETAILNALEGKKIEPRLKPPFPTINGLWDEPTLINNVETLYNVSLVDKGEFHNERFYTINGPVKKKGVYAFPADWTIEKVLRQSGNYPDFPFFVQVGGDASGDVLNQKQLKVPASGAASITVYDLKKHDSAKLLRYWLKFFQAESCGQCTPCREGTYRLNRILEKKKVDWKMFQAILTDLSETSFCALGASVPVPVWSYFKNILNNKNVSL